MEIGTIVKLVRPITNYEQIYRGELGIIENIITIDKLENDKVSYPNLVVSFFDFLGGVYTTVLHKHEVLGIIK